MKVLIGGVVALVAAAVVVAITADSPNTGFASNAAALTFVGAVALGIERILEIAWTLVGQSSLGGWWPLNKVRQAADEFEKAAEAVLSPLDEVETGLKNLMSGLSEQDEAARTLQAHVAEVQAVRPRLEAKLAQARQLAPGSARLSLVSAVAEEAANLVNRTATDADEALTDIRRRMQQAQGGMNTALDVIDAFQDNPARRLASLIAGAFLGLVVAGLSQLNLFVATLADDGGQLDGVLGGRTGVVLTGIILGFGASPTHEIVKGLQRYKERKDPGVAVFDGAVAPVAAIGTTMAAAPMAIGRAAAVAPATIDLTADPAAAPASAAVAAAVEIAEEAPIDDVRAPGPVAAPVRVVTVAPMPARRIRSTD